MAKGLKPWRDSASLIVLARRQAPVVQIKRTNYDILFQKRLNTASSFPNSIVFPGGVTEDTDFSPKWVEYIQSCGIKQDQLNTICSKGVAPIFQEDPLKRNIGLRITAIREAFEELGILICTHKSHNKNENNIWANAITDFDVRGWQHKVHNNAEEFLQLCRSLDCYPDIWALHYWNNWLTPPVYKNRFNTAFFVTAFEKKPEITFEESEVSGYRWAALEDALERSAKREIELLPPQQYELLRLSRHHNLDDLVQLAAGQSTSYKEAYSPVNIIVKDGAAFILPGDDMYPKNMDHNKNYTKKLESLTLEELRSGCRKIHRFEKTADRWELISNLLI